MTSHASAEPIRSAIGIVVVPVLLAAGAIAVGPPALVAVAAFAVAIRMVTRRLGRERGSYAALVASAMYAGVYAEAHHGSSGAPARVELLAMAAFMVAAWTSSRAPRVRSQVPDGSQDLDGSQIPDAGGVAAHDELALVGGDAGELLVDQRP
jgi:hypothetical protein